jgi:spermidine/putrescine transport system permease protein
MTAADRWAARIYRGYVVAFYLLLFAPLVVVAVFAFNSSLFPAPPWKSFTLDWFFAANALGSGRPGLLGDPGMLAAIGNSFKVALPVTVISVVAGTVNAFLMERRRFPGQALLGMMLLLPLVIPGVILGISILAFSSAVAEWLEALLNTDLDVLRPGLPLVILGQCSFTITVTTLIISARLRKLDPMLEEAARDLGAGSARVLRTVVLPFLAPACVGGGLVSFLMSFENFNTTLMLVGPRPTLPVYMYSLMREGTTPVVNAASLAVMLMTALAALIVVLLAGRSPSST